MKEGKKMSGRAWLRKAAVCAVFAVMVASVAPSDETLTEQWVNPGSARSVMYTNYLNALADAFYYWNLRPAASYKELCESPFAKAFPCDAIKNPYAPEETLREGNAPGQLRWISDGIQTRFGIVPEGDAGFEPRDRAHVWSSLRIIREKLGVPAELAFEQRRKRKIADFTPEEQSLWFLGFYLKFRWFHEFHNECEVPGDLKAFLRMRQDRMSQSLAPDGGARGPVGGRFSVINGLRNPLTGTPLVETPEGKPGYVKVERSRAGRSELVVLGLDGSPLVQTPVLHRSCPSAVPKF
jgi:hypothetical protein